MEIRDLASDRIKRIRKRYLCDLSVISVQRARYYTEKWRETENDGLSTGVRVALAMKNVYEKMNLLIDPDDRIAGTWTEDYVGIPLDLERGLFNDVMEIELDRLSMLTCLVKGNIKFIIYMLKRYGILDFYRNMKKMKAVGAAMPGIGLKPIHKRDINPYTIRRRDKKILKKELLPYWKGRTVIDYFKEELEKSNIYRGDVQSFFTFLPSTNSKNETIISTGAAVGNWQGHVILDHDKVLKQGLLKMREEVNEKLINDDAISAEDRDFLKSIDIALEGVIIFAQRLVEKLEEEEKKESDPTKKDILSRMLENCRKVPLFPAETFSEAVQSYWTEKAALELALPFNVHTPGRLDQVFYPYYMRDIDEGRITREEACELLEELFLKVMSHNMRPYSNFNGYFAARYEGSEPITLGGLDEDGRDATNELTYVMLDAAERSKTCLNFAVRFHDGSPEELYLKVADMQYHGTSNVSVLNDTVCITAMEKRGYPRSDAIGYAMASCVDLCIPAKTGSIAFSAVLLCRILDMTLRNGDAKTLVGTVKGVGLKTGDPDSFKSYEEIEDAFVAQVGFQIKQIADAACIRDRVYAEHLPSPHISAFVQGPLEKNMDITRGGGVYDLEGILFMSSIANVVDSLFVIKKLIFEQKRFTFKRLIEAIDHNYVGHEDIHAMILGVDGKWGNGSPGTDEIAHRVTKRIFDETFKHKTYKGGFVAPFVNSMTSHTYDGRVCIATPDGRKAAKPFAASCNPYNVDKNGPTGVLRSVSAIDFTNVLGTAVNIRMHPSAIGEHVEMRKKWISLIKTYFSMGGEQLQPTVVSTEVLRAAQKDPDRYQNVIVKVGGYSAYFVDLGHEIQDEVISRSEHRLL
jgi:pyruvate-formate lyase